MVTKSIISVGNMLAYSLPMESFLHLLISTALCVTCTYFPGLNCSRHALLSRNWILRYKFINGFRKCTLTKNLIGTPGLSKCTLTKKSTWNMDDFRLLVMNNILACGKLYKRKQTKL